MHTAPYATLDELSASTVPMQGYDADWYNKMMHRIPDFRSVRREMWVLEQVKGKTILHVGPTEPLHSALCQQAKKVYGLDCNTELGEHVEHFIHYDLDMIEEKPELPDDIELVLFAEVLEHLTMPGLALRRFKAFGRPIIITVPNAFNPTNMLAIKHKFEQVNSDHTAWYSYHTLKALLEKCELGVAEWLWYNGEPRLAEGLIARIEP